jgi:hypothetical protein
MTNERDARTRIVLSWLREDGHEDAERVLLRALDVVDTTPQRRPVWPARRMPDMNAYAKLAVAIAAVVVIAVAGLQFMPRPGQAGGPPTATPSPTPLSTPSPTPSPTSSPMSAPIGQLPAKATTLTPGRYSLGWSGPATSIEVPSGWTGEVAQIRKNTDRPDELGWGGWPGAAFKVYDDACGPEAEPTTVPQSVGSLVTALDAQVGTDATVTDVSFGGVVGKRIELVQAAGLDRATCSDGATGPLKIWFDDAIGYNAISPGYRAIVHAFDVNGRLVVFSGAIGAQAAASDVAELEAIISSTRFGP